MAEMTFDCPLCNQAVTCDEQWCGHEIQCPVCQGTMTVPAQQMPSIATAAEANNPLVPKPPAQNRLALNRHAQQPAPAENKNIPIRNLAGPPPKKKSPIGSIAAAAGAIIILGAGGYFGYQWYQNRPAKTTDAKTDAGPDAQAAAQPAAPAPRRADPPVWTLELDSAKIPEAPVTGSIGGGQFAPDTIRVDQVGAVPVLRLTQGAPTSPDRELLFYLHLRAGEQPGGQTIQATKDSKSDSVSQVVKRWKVDPGAALQAKSFASGYAMRLELGQIANGELPGKIFISLPDTEKTVVAGTFKAALNLTGAVSAAPTQTPVQPPTRVRRAGTVSAPDRYGVSGGL